MHVRQADPAKTKHVRMRTFTVWILPLIATVPRQPDGSES